MINPENTCTQSPKILCIESCKQNQDEKQFKRTIVLRKRKTIEYGEFKQRQSTIPTVFGTTSPYNPIVILPALGFDVLTYQSK